MQNTKQNAPPDDNISGLACQTAPCRQKKGLSAGIGENIQISMIQ
jgi:hypothetical protein